MRRGLALLLVVAAAGAADWSPARFAKLSPDFPVASFRLVDLNGDGRDEMLVIGVRGEVRIWTAAGKKLAPAPLGRLVLPDPSHTLLALGRFLGKEAPLQLLAISRRGAVVHAALPDGSLSAEGVRIGRRVRFRLRTGAPLFADIAQDVNRDGRPDVVVPGQNFSELWLNRLPKGSDAAAPAARLVRSARVPIEVARTDRRSTARLSDRLQSSFSVPRLRMTDVNGDGRKDLVVEVGRDRSFHIQRPDGTIPPEPDTKLDLRIFRDTTPQAAIRPGRTLAGGDRARYQSRDLDGDGIPDYVIAHRRKVWVFHGNREKPQFTEPTTILKVSDDVTALLLTSLDEDDYVDLLLLKVQVPTVATLVLGALAEWNLEVTALGYANGDGRRFEPAPKWRSEITVRLPSILSVLKDPGALLGRVEEIGSRFRPVQQGDLDGDGATETFILAPGSARVEIWRGRKEGAAAAREADELFRQLLFEEKDNTWTLDRIFELFGQLADERSHRLTGGRAADARIDLRDPARFEQLGFALGDLDGDGRAEIVIHYLATGASAQAHFDLLRLP